MLVKRVAEGSIAWRCGIRAGALRANIEGADIILGGDTILRVNRVPVGSDGNYDEIYESVGTLKPGDTLKITVFRNGQVVKLSTQIPE